MDELELLIAIVVGIYKLIRFVLVSIFRLLAGMFGFFKRAQSGGELAPRKEPERAPPSAKRAPPPLPQARSTPARAAADQVKAVSDQLAALARTAEAESQKCA